MSDGVVMRTQKKNDRKRGQQLQPRIDRRVNRDSQNSWLEFQDDTMNKSIDSTQYNALCPRVIYSFVRMESHTTHRLHNC